MRHILVRREAAGLEDGRAGEALSAPSRPILRHILVRIEAAGLEDGRTDGAMCDPGWPISRLILDPGDLDWEMVRRWWS